MASLMAAIDVVAKLSADKVYCAYMSGSNNLSPQNTLAVEAIAILFDADKDWLHKEVGKTIVKHMQALKDKEPRNR